MFLTIFQAFSEKNQEQLGQKQDLCYTKFCMMPLVLWQSREKKVCGWKELRYILFYIMKKVSLREAFGA